MGEGLARGRGRGRGEGVEERGWGGGGGWFGDEGEAGGDNAEGVGHDGGCLENEQD